MIGKHKTKFDLKFNKDFWKPILPPLVIKRISMVKRLENGDYIYEIEYGEE